MSKYTLIRGLAATGFAALLSACVTNPSKPDGAPASPGAGGGAAPATAPAEPGLVDRARAGADGLLQRARESVAAPVDANTVTIGVLKAGRIPADAPKDKTGFYVADPAQAEALKGPLQAFAQAAVRQAAPGKKVTLRAEGDGIAGYFSSLKNTITGNQTVVGVEYGQATALGSDKKCVVMPVRLFEGKVSPDGKSSSMNSTPSATGLMQVCPPGGVKDPNAKPERGPSVLDLIRSNTSGTPKPQ